MQQQDAGEEEQQHEEVVASLDDEREELRVQREERDEREAVVHAAREERNHGEGRDESRQIQVALVPEEPDLVEEPHERGRDQEQEREVREVIQRGVVHHRPVVEGRVEVIGDVGVLPEQELPCGPLDHQRSVVDVRVRLPRLTQQDRGERRDDDEDGDDGAEVERSLTRREGRPPAVIAHRVCDRKHAAGDEEQDVGAEWEQLPERHVRRRRDGRVVPEQE